MENDCTGIGNGVYLNDPVQQHRLHLTIVRLPQVLIHVAQWPWSLLNRWRSVEFTGCKLKRSTKAEMTMHAQLAHSYQQRLAVIVWRIIAAGRTQVFSICDSTCS